jgi:hypothetical protein
MDRGIKLTTPRLPEAINIEGQATSVVRLKHNNMWIVFALFGGFYITVAFISFYYLDHEDYSRFYIVSDRWMIVVQIDLFLSFKFVIGLAEAFLDARAQSNASFA